MTHFSFVEQRNNLGLQNLGVDLTAGKACIKRKISVKTRRCECK